jgi:hypothetical protein
MEPKLNKVYINGQEAPTTTTEAATPTNEVPAPPPPKIGKVYINGHEAVHKGCGGMAIAFPDVCLCPPGPPAGPVPVPLTNVVQAKDMVCGALTVVIQGYPAGHSDSYFATSTGSEVSRNTGGGIISHAVQGAAHFASSSPDVLIEGKYAVRDGDLVTQGHKNRMPANCPPSVWMGTVCPGGVPKTIPKNKTHVLQEGTDWIEISLVDEADEPIAYTPFRFKTPKQALVDGRFLWGGKLTIRKMAQGRCELVLPEVDAIGNQTPSAHAPADTIRYRPGQPLLLVSGKNYRVFVAQMRTLFVELPLPPSTSKADRYILRSDDDRYSVSRTVADDLVTEDNILTLAFPKVIKGPKYTLTHDDCAGHPHDIFTGLTFDDLFPKEPCSPYDEPVATIDLRFGIGQRRSG